MHEEQVTEPTSAPASICIAGATGWTGRALVAGVLGAPDLRLTSAVSRSAAGQDLGHALQRDRLEVPVFATVEEALDGVDVLIEYTSHLSAVRHALTAIEAGVAVVIGSSGLTAGDFDEIDRAATAAGVGVISAGNFSLTAAMALAASELAAAHLSRWEVIDYASSTKPDAPSGTALELAERLQQVREPEVDVPVDQVAGRPEARGADVAGTRVHSVRLPGFVVSTEIVFAQADERLTIRHDAGGTPAPYVAGTLLAARQVRRRIGLTRGLDRLLLEEG